MRSTIYHKLDEMLFEVDSDFEFSADGEIFVEKHGKNYPLANLDSDKVVFDYRKIDHYVLNDAIDLKRILDSNKIGYSEINRN